MTGRLSIGDFARTTHLSVKALRHYHDIGLLEPSEVDAHSGYRYYRPEQVPMAQVILRLRDLGMPLDRVKAVVDAPDVPRRNAEIAAHLVRMEEQLGRTRATVADLRALLTTPPRRQPVVLRTIPAVQAVAITDRVLVSEFGPWWTSAFTALFDHLRAECVARSGTPGAIYTGEVFEDEQGDITAFVPIDRPVSGTARITTVDVPSIEAATVVHEGALADLDMAYGALGIELAERGGIGLPGPIREYYQVSAFDTDDESRHRTEVCWPVFRTVT